MSDEKDKSKSPLAERAFELFQDRSARLGANYDKRTLSIQCFADAETFEKTAAEIASGKLDPSKVIHPPKRKDSVLNDAYAPNLKPTHRINRMSSLNADGTPKADLEAAEKDAREAMNMDAAAQVANNIEHGKIGPV